MSPDTNRTESAAEESATDAGMDVVLSGDSILTKRISDIEDESFRSLRDLFRSVDLAFTHLETIIHDYDNRDDLWPAAEAGGTWLRSPPFVADELDWLGVDLVSHPSNHALDYSYGGLYSTWKALDAVEIPYAGTGRNLGDARAPAYRETGNGRVGLVSMASSVTRWSRAGSQHQDLQGRPGLNPLRYRQVVDEETRDQLLDLGKQFGQWIVKTGDDEWEFTPPGIHNTTTIFEVDDEHAPATVPHPRDRTGNLRAIREADRQADVVLAHIHSHEFDPQIGMEAPPQFVRSFAKDAIDTGADIFVAQGSHNPRGIEWYDGAPIFYDLGDLFTMHEYVTKLPADFYEKYDSLMDSHWAEATPAEAFEARSTTSYKNAVHPPEGYWSAPVDGCIVPVCSFDDDFGVSDVELHPFVRFDEPEHLAGAPSRATGDEATELLEFVADLSAEFGTEVRLEEGVGILNPEWE